MQSKKNLLCATLLNITKSINGKPVEKQGRKATGLKLWKHNHERQAAESHIL